jgi:hypothetical protein
MRAAADRTRHARVDHARLARDRELRELAGHLRAALPRVPSGYQPGRDALVETIARLTDSPASAASHAVEEMIELGLVKYDAGGRGIGAAGVWTYPRSASIGSRAPARRRRTR